VSVIFRPDSVDITKAACSNFGLDDKGLLEIRNLFGRVINLERLKWVRARKKCKIDHTFVFLKGDSCNVDDLVESTNVTSWATFASKIYWTNLFSLHYEKQDIFNANLVVCWTVWILEDRFLSAVLEAALWVVFCVPTAKYQFVMKRKYLAKPKWNETFFVEKVCSWSRNVGKGLTELLWLSGDLLLCWGVKVGLGSIS